MLCWADSGENCGLEFAITEIKKAAEKLPQSGKIRTLIQKVEYQMRYRKSSEIFPGSGALPTLQSDSRY
jgi:hypothetical protein